MAGKKAAKKAEKETTYKIRQEAQQQAAARSAVANQSNTLIYKKPYFRCQQISFRKMMNASAAAPAFSMGKGKERDIVARKDRDLKNTGPGSYDPNLGHHKKEPSYSMGAKLQSSLVKAGAAIMPEPGRYNPSHTYSK